MRARVNESRLDSTPSLDLSRASSPTNQKVNERSARTSLHRGGGVLLPVMQEALDEAFKHATPHVPVPPDAVKADSCSEMPADEHNDQPYTRINFMVGNVIFFSWRRRRFFGFFFV